MVILYKFNGTVWEAVDRGVIGKVDIYCKLGYVCEVMR